MRGRVRGRGGRERRERQEEGGGRREERNRIAEEKEEKQRCGSQVQGKRIPHSSQPFTSTPPPPSASSAAATAALFPLSTALERWSGSTVESAVLADAPWYGPPVCPTLALLAACDASTAPWTLPLRSSSSAALPPEDGGVAQLSHSSVEAVVPLLLLWSAERASPGTTKKPSSSSAAPLEALALEEILVFLAWRASLAHSTFSLRGGAAHGQRMTMMFPLRMTGRCVGAGDSDEAKWGHGARMAASSPSPG